MNKKERNKIIIRTTVFTTAINLFLASCKIIIGYISGSIGIITDGINNTSDSLCAICSLIGFSISKKVPTSNHPLGYGRIEYISSLIVSLFIIYASFSCLTSSISRILNPSKVVFSPIMLIILLFSICAKIAIMIINKKNGKKTKYEALIITGEDAKADILSTLLTIISLITSQFTQFPIDGIIGLFISILIGKSGFEALISTTSAIVGQRPDSKTVKEIRRIIKCHQPLSGGYDIILHSYGPERTIGQCNIEVPMDTKAEEIFDAMTDASKEIFEKLNINFTFGLFAVNDSIPFVKEMKDKVLIELQNHSKHIISIHAFHIHMDTKKVHFDVVVDFSQHNYPLLKQQLENVLKNRWPEYEFFITIDPDLA